MDEEWHRWQNSLSGKWTNAIKPLAPIGQGCNPSESKIMGGGEVMEFVAALNHDKNPATRAVTKASAIGAQICTPIESGKELSVRTSAIWPQHLPLSWMLRNPKRTRSSGNQCRNPYDFIIDDSDKEVERTAPGKREQIPKAATDPVIWRVIQTGTRHGRSYRPLIRNKGDYDIYHLVFLASQPFHPRTLGYFPESGATTNLVDQTSERWRLVFARLCGST